MVLAVLVGIVLLVVGENVPQPVPLNQIEVIFGWVAIVISVLLLVLVLVGQRTYDRKRWYW